MNGALLPLLAPTGIVMVWPFDNATTRSLPVTALLTAAVYTIDPPSVTLPVEGGTQTEKRAGTELGSPSQAYPHYKSVGILDWDLADFGATLTGRYISHLQEAGDPNKLGSRLYADAQIRWTPSFISPDLGIAVGVNNLFDKDPPGCVTCGLNNYDPNAYDAPGRFMYLRLSYRH